MRYPRPEHNSRTRRLAAGARRALSSASSVRCSDDRSATRGKENGWLRTRGNSTTIRARIARKEEKSGRRLVMARAPRLDDGPLSCCRGSAVVRVREPSSFDVYNPHSCALHR
ncbi:unnamed protein product [Trichogramma brassicae]|uniref:Uncharacterized protein n=1 Tax=Trichogramma brassicae TaxID=86971 RepID=A0A6H5I0H8_9HYME|nr:unnamed protein product [Trichogramma brassicae]